MDSPRGAVCSERTHEVTTLAKAQEWLPSATEADLPMRIEQREANGRLHVRFYDPDGKLIGKRG